MAVIHIRVRATQETVNRRPIPLTAFWQLWIIRPMIELNEDVMEWVDADERNINDQDNEGGWYAEHELARGRFDRGRFAWL